MKNYFIFIGLSLFLHSCKKQSDTLTFPAELTEQEKDALRCGLFLNPENAVVTEDFVLVENHVIVHRPSLLETSWDIPQGEVNAQERQYSPTTKSIPSYSRISDVKVFIRIPPENSWYPYIQPAFNKWNDLPGCKAHISFVSSEQQADVIVEFENEEPYPIGWTSQSYPVWGCLPWTDGGPGRRIYVWSGGVVLSDARRQYLFAHAVGHVLGFMHSNEPDEPLYSPCNDVWGKVHLHGTPVTDNTSIMVDEFSTPQPQPTNLNANDVYAAQLLYPLVLDPPTVTGICCITPLGIGGLKSFNISVNYPTGGQPLYGIEFRFVRNGSNNYYVSFVANSSTFSIGGLPSGNYTVYARGKNYKFDFSGAYSSGYNFTL